MGKIIVITSGKGGSGKTTLTAALGSALVRRGKTVCLVDLCLGLRNLDLLLGLQDQVVFDLYDLSDDACTMEQALLKVPQQEQLYMVAAPQQDLANGIGEKPLQHVLERLTKRFDYVLLDTPGALSAITVQVSQWADAVLVIALSGAMAERNTERALAALRETSSARFCLLFNQYDRRMAATNKLTSPDAFSAYLDVPLLGILPQSEEIALSGLSAQASAWPQKLISIVDQAAKWLDGEDNPSQVAERRFTWRSFIKKG